MEQRLGFVHSEMDIKILILFIMRRLAAPVDRESLTDITLLCDDAIGYFEFSDCLHDLVRTEHITQSDGRYTITDKGRKNGEAMESDLAYSVRMRAEKAAYNLSGILQRESMITATHQMRKRGGYTIKLGMADGIGPIISMELLCGDDEQTKLIEKNFKKNAESIYLKIIDLLLEGK